MEFFLIVLAAATTVSAYQSCTPGAYYRTECNTCICNEDGSASICTEKPCPIGIFNQDGSLKAPLDIIKEIIPEATEIEITKSKLVEENHVSYVEVCTPNSAFHIDCNSCTCSTRGTEYVCTKMGCRSNSLRHTQIGHPQIAKSAEEKFCEPGSVFRDYCNTCVCSKDGLKAACTLKLCDKTVYNRDGSIKDLEKNHKRVARSTNDQVCEPKSQFKEYCNSCVCSADGSNYACTKKACDQNIFNKDGTFKAPLVCEPLSHFYDYCNICTCSKDGLAAACTKRACDKGMFNKNGSLKYPFSSLIRAYRSVEQKKVCEPGKLFYNYCNQCACALDGSAFACTKMYCDKNTWNKDGTLKTEIKSKVETCTF